MISSEGVWQKAYVNLGLRGPPMLGGLADAARHLVFLMGCGLVWFVLSRYKSIHDIPRNHLALLGLGRLALIYLFILAVSQ